MKIIDIKTNMVYAEYFQDLGSTYEVEGYVEYGVAEDVDAGGYRVEYKGRAVYLLVHAHNADTVHIYYVGGGDDVIPNDFTLEVTKVVRTILAELT